jgi:hypothetical protein
MWRCIEDCQAYRKTNIEVATKLTLYPFKYCGGTCKLHHNHSKLVIEADFFVDSYHYQNSTLEPNLELGTKEFPFRSLDDAFRTIFNNNNQSFNYTINVKHGSNLSIHSEDMPLIVLNSNVELK